MRGYMQLYSPLASSMHNACFGIDILKTYVHKENMVLQRLFSLNFFVGVLFSSEMYFFQVWPSGMSYLLLFTMVKFRIGTAAPAVKGLCDFVYF